MGVKESEDMVHKKRAKRTNDKMMGRFFGPPCALFIIYIYYTYNNISSTAQLARFYTCHQPNRHTAATILRGLWPEIFAESIYNGQCTDFTDALDFHSFLWNILSALCNFFALFMYYIRARLFELMH